MIKDALAVALSGEAPPVVTLSPRAPLLQFIPDAYFAVILPVLVYWVYSLMFLFIDTYDLLPQYRIHTPEEITSRNKVTLYQVMRDVAIQQILQVLAGMVLHHFEATEMVGGDLLDMWKLHRMLLPVFGSLSPQTIRALYYYILPTARIICAFFVIDTWQYFWHRYFHINKALYKMIHSRHHRLYVPYALGALYNHPLEGLVLDTGGGGVAMLLCGLSSREALIFFTFSTLKTVDDHCGYEIPYDLLQIVFQNNAHYHDIHHQNFGIKSNFSQPFFIHWDKLLGTEYAGHSKSHSHLPDHTISHDKKD
ncbi:hypothetical protein CANCADRAFT_2564 [Tortispora caseinolytica NRRL Y-17796]|uniref:Fatty acid hydroxylase domain-containing protein n=1 Tax=Tortispora caseinolytica NRRL Y-17796 TaxID=767744 RepID=A0A1E4TGD8_9ASCO|nr:hypothetical protein CANCADRAFT_2564 [Tortispora caseinolytica NRRL Y-17796]